VILQEEPFSKPLDEIKQMTSTQINDLLTGSEKLEPELRWEKMTPEVRAKARRHGYHE